jgi:CDP-diacylglycerol--glycerol-3-phosphate 3-phosphatidyltransferase
MLSEPFEARVRDITQRIAGRLLGRSGISPNTITGIGFVLTLAVTYTLATGHLALGGVLVLLTSAFDMLDGALARATDRKSAFGAFFDSTVDRYTEALILLGLLVYYERHAAMGWEIPLVYLSIVGSLMVSYTRARAEALGFDGKVGLLARPERIILLAFGLLVGWHSFAVAILAIFTNFTAAQRVYHVWRQDRARHPRPVVPKAPRRSWFAPRDQTPS